jgi:hypothetical protein
MASGEMSGSEFLAFNLAWIKAALSHLADGGLFGTFIDWARPADRARGGDATRTNSPGGDQRTP